MDERVARQRRATSFRVATVAVVFLCVGACERKPVADLAKLRPVMEKFLQAEREHRGSHGNFWRDRQAKIDRNEAMKNLGVDLGVAGDFEFTIEPREDGADTMLRITARGLGASSSIALSCVQKAQEAKADCKENAGA
jgi:hypothetical protein